MGLLRSSASMYKGPSLAPNLPFLYCFQSQKKPSSLFNFGPLPLGFCLPEIYPTTLHPTVLICVTLSWTSTSKVTHSSMSSLAPESEVAYVQVCLGPCNTFCCAHHSPFPLLCSWAHEVLFTCLLPTSLYSPIGQQLCLLPHWAFPRRHLDPSLRVPWVLVLARELGLLGSEERLFPARTEAGGGWRGKIG